MRIIQLKSRLIYKILSDPAPYPFNNLKNFDELWILNVLITENKTNQRSLIFEIKLHVSESTRQENIFIAEDLKECCVSYSLGAPTQAKNKC